jgi:hypothetical protein
MRENSLISLNDKLNSIISEGNFFYSDVFYQFDKELRLTLDLRQFIQELLSDSENDSIAIYGAGNFSHSLFEYVDMSKCNIVCAVDNDEKKKEFYGYPVIRVGDIIKYNVNTIIVSSYSGEEMINSIPENVNCRIMDICKELNRVTDNCFNGLLLNDFNCQYFKYIRHSNALRSAYNSYKKNKESVFLTHVIYEYLQFKDIKSAVAYLNEYLSISPEPELKNLKEKLTGLLNDIKIKLRAKNNARGLMVLADAVSSEDINQETTPFLFGFGLDNILCTNAYTHTGWTSTSILSMFKQKSYIDNRLYSNTQLNGNEHFFEVLYKNEMGFHYSIPVERKLIFANLPDKSISHNLLCSFAIWEYLCRLYDRDENDVTILHFLETHPPYDLIVCDAVFDENDLSYHNREKYLCALKYYDSQMELLMDLLPSNSGIIFVSDHGQGNNDFRNFMIHNNEYCKVPLIVRDGTAIHSTENRIISNIDALSVLLNLITAKPAFVGIKHRNLAELNNEFFHSPSIFEFYYSFGNTDAGRAYKCFISDTDKYLIFYDGEERYFLISDDRNNLINDINYQDRIEWYRQNVNRDFPDWSDDNGRYSETRKYFKI